MASRDFSGEDIVKALRKMGYRHDRTRGSHAILKYTNPDTGEQRTVTVPLHDRIRVGTLQSIAEQCGADDFQAWCEWIDDLLKIWAPLGDGHGAGRVHSGVAE